MKQTSFRLARSFYWLALSLHLGGLAVLGAIAAPPLFSTLKDREVRLPMTHFLIDDARELGGDVFGNILGRFHIVESVCVLVMLAVLAMEFLWWLGAHRVKAAHLVRLGLTLATAVLVAYDIFVLTPQVLAVRQSWFDSGTVAAAAPLKAQFDSLHHFSELLGKTRVYLLLGALICTAFTTPLPPPAEQTSVEIHHA